MAAEFLGAGWAFPVGPGEDGTIARAAYEEAVRRSIWLILSTSRGERVMRPDFGCGIHDLVFALNNAATAGRVEQETRLALLNWEPRIELLSLEVGPGPGNPALLLIRIDYRVRTTNNVFNLVYPFYLKDTA